MAYCIKVDGEIVLVATDEKFDSFIKTIKKYEPDSLLKKLAPSAPLNKTI